MKFNLEQEYQKYLKRVQLSETTMHPDQKRETRRAFVGGITQLFVFATTDMIKLPEEQSNEALQHINDQLTRFWTIESQTLN